MTPPAPARVFGFVAAEADVCVLLRRGPSKRVLMVKWDLAADEFEIGQWLNAQVYRDPCDLSPDGRLFTYQANDGRYREAHGGVYSVVCRPPYFTALAFWAQGSNARGFRWVEPSMLRSLLEAIDAPTKGTLPDFYRKRLGVQDYEKSIARRGWKAVPSPTRERSYSKECVFGTLRWHPPAAPRRESYGIDSASLGAEWAEVDHRGRLLLAREGKVFVRDQDGERELIDLNPLEFQPVAPPAWATEWPE